MTDPRLVPISSQLKQLQRVMDDAAWNGDSATYDKLKVRRDRLLALQAEGALYEPRF